MAFSKETTASIESTVSPAFEELVIKGTRDLIKTIHEEIKNSKQLSDDTRKRCDAILAKVQKQYLRLQINFYREQKILITEALAIVRINNKSSELDEYYKVWINTLETYTRESKKLIGPILQVLTAICAESAELNNKFKWCLTSGVISSAVCISAVVGVIIHYIPMLAWTIPSVIGGPEGFAIAAVYASALALTCLSGCINYHEMRAAYRSCSLKIQIHITQYFPDLSNKTDQPVTSDQLIVALRKALDTFEMNNDMWHSNKMLNSFDRRTDALLMSLNEDYNETSKNG